MGENKVLATVNGKEISQNDLDILMKSLSPQVAAQFNGEEGKKRLIDELVSQELFYLDAVKNGLDKEEEFTSELIKVKENLLKQYAVKKTLSDITVSDEEVADYYNQNKNYFQNPESLKASHILVDDEETANKILDEIKGGLAFEDAAKNNSKCPSNANGGDLGYFTRGKMIPEFEKVAFELKEGEISQPVKTQFGYHIIKLVDRKEPSVSPLEEVQAELRRQIVGMKQNEAYMNKTNELKKQYEVVINQ
jgi:peptidyl-prolyl cis-trans isomerase C